jgi:membrane protease subunit (stomatin/prohibitin family)
MIARTNPASMAERWSGPIAVNDTVQCTESDAAVLLMEGRVLGTLGPGTHLLSPAQMPFLDAAVDPSGALRVELWFVRTSPAHGVRVGGSLGSQLDPQTRAAVAVHWFGTVAYRVADPVRFVLTFAGVGGEAGEVRPLVQAKVLASLQPLAAQFIQRRGSVAALLDPSGAAEILPALQNAATAELAGLGLQLIATEQSSFSLPGSAGAGQGPAAAQPSERTYEMLWDCPHCGARKNLGLTHRHCPNCGSAQDAQWRYFPSDDEKVAVEDHVYVGADLQCQYCGNFNSRRAKHCGGCGAPLEGGKEVVRRQDQFGTGYYAGQTQQDARREATAHRAPPPAPAKTRRLLPWLVGGGCLTVLLVGVVLALVFFLWKSEGALEVAGHSWKREIHIERFGPVDDSSWCDQMPSGARQVRRAREVRSHRKVPDGQDCRTRRVDRGDGTYVERQECTPRYRSEPVHDDKCYYQIERWSHARTERASGESAQPEPHWPKVELGRTGNCVGCEREGKRSEEYVVRFVESSSGESARCEFDQKRWASFRAGSRWTGQLSMLGGVLDCSSLKPQ